jgi:hypothetical protein
MDPQLSFAPKSIALAQKVVKISFVENLLFLCEKVNFDFLYKNVLIPASFENSSVFFSIS